MAKRKALITGVTGQDGAYLARFLIQKGYEVHGMRRMTSHLNIQHVETLISDPREKEGSFYLHLGDMVDSGSLIRLIEKIQPDEVYNLAAQSHVHVSFSSPEYTAQVNALGTLRILEAIKILKLEGKTKFYQASTSELFGNSDSEKQSELTPFLPCSPYAISKLYAYWITINYRESYGMFACNGILFNHESPLRGETFVTRKITLGIAKFIYGMVDCIHLGNLNAKRDWGHAKDYVEMQWLMLQQAEAKDYVIASGETHSVRHFLEVAFQYLGITLSWSGQGVEEIGRIEAVNFSILEERLGFYPKNIVNGMTCVRVDPFYFRPSELSRLQGDARRASLELGWKPKIPFIKLVEEMLLADLFSMQQRFLSRDLLIKEAVK